MVLKASRRVDAITGRIGRYAAVIPLSPNGWTLLSLLPAGLGVGALLVEELAIAIVLFALAGAIDAIDGAVARARDEASAVGAYLDGMVDRVVEAALLFGLMLFGYPDWIVPGWMWLALLLFFGTAMTSFARAYADHRNVVTDPAQLADLGGLLERAERLLLIVSSMLVWFIDPLFATYVIALGVGLAVVTVIQRMVGVIRAGSD